MAFLNGIQFFFITFSFVYVTVHAVVYNPSDQESFDGGKYKLFWAFNATEDKVYFKVEVETTGYVALGFSDQGAGMLNLDCVVAGVAANRGYIMDLKAKSTSSNPDLDTDQNYVLESRSESSTKTTVEFSRTRDTGDSSQDMTFVPGQAVYVAWAYGLDDAPTHADLQYHQESGYGVNKLVFVPLVPSTVATSTPKSPTKALPTVVTAKPSLTKALPTVAISKPSPKEAIPTIVVSTAQPTNVTLSSAFTPVIATSKSPSTESKGSRSCCQCLFLFAFVVIATLI